MIDYSDAKNSTQAFYDAFAETYAARHAAKPIVALEKFHALLPGISRILDIGCGGGRDATALKEMGYAVIGVDFSYSMCTIARTHAIPVIQADSTAMPFKTPGYFQGAWIRNSLLHIPKKDMVPVLSNVHELLSHRGILFLGLKEGTGEELKTSKNGTTLYSYWTSGEIQEILSRCGFDVIEAKRGEIDSFNERFCLEIFSVKNN